MKTMIPTRLIGPIKICGKEIVDKIRVPLATLETPLWPSVSRGAKLSRLCGGINAYIVDECMTRSVLLEADDTETILNAMELLQKNFQKIEAVVKTTSRFTKLKDWNTQIIGNLLYLRFSFDTADAAGHNMSTKAADTLIDWILKHCPKLRYVSISGNYCVDKKASAVNGILGRGKYAIAEMLIPRDICKLTLKSIPEQINSLNLKKNMLGSILAGSIRSANAHFANMLAAFYLATGQDVANIVEGSQGFVYTEVRENGSLYFSVTLPNLIVGTVGAGKDLDYVHKNLELLGCLEKRTIGTNARRLALIAAATVLCGEISLLAAQTNRGELVRSHVELER
jgi:hydroxymethylglutaryl-CoA reductase (NADPH)